MLIEYPEFEPIKRFLYFHKILNFLWNHMIGLYNYDDADFWNQAGD